MGSSSVSCVLTGATLANEPAVLIPLAPAPYANRKHPAPGEGARVISNEGAMAIFSPLTLPIFGVVGDYGDMESFIPDANTEFLTRKMGGKKEFGRFLECVARGGNVDYIDKVAKRIRLTLGKRHRPGWDGTLRGCWVAREAWDMFSTKILDEGGTKLDSLYEGSWVTEFALKGMGFVEGQKDEATAIRLFGTGAHDGPRYNIPYTHPGLPDFIVWYDGHMSSEATYKEQKVNIKYHVRDLQKAIQKLGLTLPEASITWAKSHTMFHASLLEARRQRADRVGMSKRMVERETPLSEWKEVGNNFTDRTKEELTRRFNASMDSALKRHKGEEAEFVRLDQNLGPEFQPIYARTFCNRDPFDGPGKRDLHVTTTATTIGGEPTGFVIDPCDCTQESLSERVRFMGLLPEFKFSEDVFAVLRNRGWKQRKRRSFVDMFGYDDVHLRSLPPETSRIYRGKILSDEFLPMLEALLVFDFSMGACNRLFQPTNGGWQCGNIPMQREVAKMAWKLANDKQKKRRSWG